MRARSAQRFELRLDVGEGSIEYDRVAKQGHVKSVEHRMEKVTELLGDIMRSHERLKVRRAAQWAQWYCFTL